MLRRTCSEAAAFRHNGGTFRAYLAVSIDSILARLKSVLRTEPARRRPEDECRRVETALTDNERRFRTLLDGIDDAIFVHDLDTGAILAVNRRMCEMYGYTEDEALRLSVDDLSEGVPPYYLEEAVLWLMKAAIGGPQLFEWRARGKGGRLFWVEISVRRVDLDGPVDRLLVVARDIGERKRAERELRRHQELLEEQVQLRTVELVQAREEAERANHAKSTFLANMSHEIRTPMTAIIGMTHLAQYTDPTPAQREYLEKIRRSCEHLLSVVDDILDFSKIEAGRVDIQRIPFRPEAVMRNVAEQVEEKAARKGLLLVLDLDATLPPWLLGDPLRLAQVLLNLAGNAVKFTERGQIVLRATQHAVAEGGIDVRFAVSDTGIGLDAGDAARLFESFEQADTSISRKYGGSGLGLAISKRLVGMMGGSLGVDSNPGEGSTFWLDLRLAATEPPTGPVLPPSAAPSPRASLAGARVLVVEDNVFNQQIAQELLEAAGAGVTLADNGREAIERLCRQQFDCVLMDMQMPDMDGLEATRRIRADAAFAAVPIVAMTANVTKEDREECLAVGMNDFLAKPFSPERLYAVLAAVLPARAVAAAAAADAVSGAVAAVDVLDGGALARTFGDDAARMEKYVRRFVETARDGLLELEGAVSHQDAAAVKFVAHRLKSSARTVGAERFADACETLERMPAPADFAAVGAALAGMKHDVAQIDDWIGKRATMHAAKQGSQT